MGRRTLDLTGQRYGIMTVLRQDTGVPTGAGKSAHWIVRCDCGNERSISSNVLRTLHQQSCGCLRGNGARFQPKYGIPKPALQRWINMMRRCYEPTSEKDKRNYADRGIKVCAAWHDPRRFYEDVGLPPFDGATLDRINNDGDYEPSNFRWATYSQQNNNRRPLRRREVRHCHVT